MPASRYILFHLPWYSVLIVTGMITAIWLSSIEEKRLNLPADTTIDLALTLLPCGVIGARIYYVIFAWDIFKNDLWSIFRFWEGGIAIYGGVIGGAIALLIFAKRRRLSPLVLFDMIAPGVALAQAIGRWGNFFNMEAYGPIVSSPFWQFFPASVLIPEGQDLVWHMATFFYESVWDLSVFVVLWSQRAKRKYPGETLCWYLLLYGAGRLVIEGLRMDSLMSLSGNLRVSQLIAALCCSAVCLIFSWRAIRREPRNRTTFGLLLLSVVLSIVCLFCRSSTVMYIQMTLVIPLLMWLIWFTARKPHSQSSTVCSLMALVLSTGCPILCHTLSGKAWLSICLSMFFSLMMILTATFMQKFERESLQEHTGGSACPPQD